MAAWTVVPCLLALRAEIDALAPGRDRGADGTIGDSAHTSTSDHTPDEDSTVLRSRDADSRNEVHALDIDADLREPGLTLAAIVAHIVARCRSGAERRLRYVIYDRKIYEASNDWRERAYVLSDPHTNHAHFSASYASELEASTASWHLEDIPVALTDADKKWLTAQIDARADQIKAALLAALPAATADRVWRTKLDIDTSSTGVNLQEAGSILRYTSREHHQAIDGIAAVRAEVAKALAAEPGA